MDVFGYMFLMFSLVYVCLLDGSPNFALKTVLLTALIISISFVRNPVLLPSGRYSLTSIVNPNSLGMSMMSGIWSAICLKRREEINMIVMLLLSALFTYVMFQSASLKSISAVFVFLVVDYVFSIRSDVQEKKGKSVRLILDAAVVIVIIFAAYIFFTQDNIFYNTIVGQRITGIMEGTASDRRIRLYRYGFDIIRDHPIIGIGFNGFEAIVGAYSHSTLIEVIASGGFIGGFIYFFGFFAMAIKYLKNFYYEKKNHVLSTHGNGEAVAGMALMTVLLFVIIHPYEMKSYVNFALCMCLANTPKVEKGRFLNENSYSSRSKTAVY
jgi:O-antigen ligase